MSEHRVLKALKSRSKSLSLDNSSLQELPAALGRLNFITTFSAKNNALKHLPSQISALTGVCYLNLGSNKLEGRSLIHLCGLSKLLTLHLFSNCIQSIPTPLFSGLGQLQVLNLNQNSLTSLPPDVSLLTQLQQLCLSNNQLTALPSGLGALTRLQELHADGNHLSTLPHTLGDLPRLHKLMLHKNKLTTIPSSVGGCKSLAVLDVSCNQLELFPPTLLTLQLKEFYYENNPLLPHIPVPAQHQEEVLQLKEIVARRIIQELKDSVVLLHRLELEYPKLKDLLSHFSCCELCGEPFLHSWLQCVQFKSVRQVLPSLVSSPASTLIPVRANLCSYKCFNSDGHSFYGIAS